MEGDKLTYCDLIEHSIPLQEGAQPVNVRPYYRRCKYDIEEIEKKVKELLDLGVIEPSTSPFNSPLHLVKKKPDENGKIRSRIVIDFRALNEI